ncbi:hypothetical protein ACIHFD_29420 [Nonomuraea sp. NPDC051941]|uniref:hypothetical protein n=1 Tax=Nonomuraea sp. NPDC051941 TaxID=3364373 RepID=UPI0037C7EA1A
MAADTGAGVADCARLVFGGPGRPDGLDVNGAGWNALAPFGGYKQSGNGREEYLETKSIQS